MIECAKCGSENKFDGAAFCRSCGSELANPKSAAVATEVISPEENSPNQENMDRDNLDGPMNAAGEDVPNDRVELVETDLAPGDLPQNQDSRAISAQKSTTASDFDRALEKYNEPEETSLQIESASDVLIRTQSAGDKITRKSKSEANSSRRPTSAMPKPTPLSTIQANTDSGSKDSAVSPSDKQQLLDNLNKSFPNAAEQESVENSTERRTVCADSSEGVEGLEREMAAQEWVAPSRDHSIIESDTHGILHIRGNKVALSLTPPPRPGESINFRGKKYTLTKGPLDKKTLGLSAALILVLIAIIFVQQLTAPVPPQPSLFGVVKNSETNEVLAGVNVSVPQLEIFTVTDEFGAFRFAGMQNNTYQVRLEGELYEAKFYPVSITENNSAFLQASLDPLLPSTNRVRNISTPVEEPVASKPRVGQLKINCNVEDAEVIVNGKDLGKVDRTFSRMKTGDHTLVVRREGYEDFTQPIKIIPGEATVVTVNLLEIAPDTPESLTAAEHFAQAEELMQQSQFTEAAGHYTLALAKDRDYVQAYLRRADANLALDKNLAARADYRAAADYYLNAESYSQAIVCFDKILDLAPNSVGALQMRGWAKVWTHDTEGGLFDLNRALSIVPDDADARFQVGKALYVTGNFKEAEKSLKKLKDDADQKPEIYAYLALTHLARGDQKDARKTYEKFQERASSSLQARMSTESDWQKLLAIQEN